MKKTMIIAAISILTACNSGTNTTSVPDSTTTNMDSIKVADSSVAATDTTTAQIGKQ